MVERALTLEVPDAPHAVREPSRPRAANAGLRARLWRSERGTAVVEFALIAPVLFLLVFGVIDFARALNYYNNLTQIAGQGARAAAVNRNPDGTAVGSSSLGCSGPLSIQCQLAKSYTSPELRSKVDVCIPSLPTNPGDPVTVRATFSFKFIPLVRVVAIRLAAASTERFEAPQPTYASGDFTIGGPAGDACNPPPP